MQGGIGSGRALLSDTIGFGIYTLRAYTNWMKNFMPDNCFSTRLTIHDKSVRDDYTVQVNDPTIPVKMVDDEAPVDLIINDNTIPGKVLAEIRANKSFRSSNLNICYLFVETHGVINFKSEIKLSGGRATIEIPAENIISGINHYTIFDQKGNPVYEKYIYNREEETDFSALKLFAPDSCKPREKVELGISLIKPSLSDGSAYLSVSVTPSGTYTGTFINEYMIFGSEFGEIPQEFLQSGSVPDSSVDNFLSQRRSRWIDWEIILSGKYPVIKYEKETRHHYLYCHDLNLQSDSTLNERLFLSVPGKNATFQYAGRNPDGSYVFSIPTDTNTRDIIIQPETEGHAFNPGSSFSDKYKELNTWDSSELISDSVGPRLALNSRITAIFRSFDPPPKKQKPVLARAERRFYGVPDVSIKMADYISLPTMQEIFFEIIPGVSMKSEKSGYQITIRDPMTQMRHDNPMLFIDGVVVRDPALIAGIDPALVEKIDVIASRYMIGDYIMPGVINVITKNGDLSDITLPHGPARMQYRAFDPAGEFIFKDYTLPENRNSRIPDFRNTMYWNTISLSSKDTRETFEFSASDFLSGYDIIVQGITADGRLISLKKKLDLCR
jgi:hypothetical protein